MSFDVSKLNLSYSEFVGLIDELYDEVLIYDNNYTIVYINKACERHYGMTQEEMVGRSFWDFQDQYWNLSVLPHVYKEKKAFMQKQSTYMGSEILTIALPIFDQNGEIEYVVMSVRDDFSNVRLNYLYDVLTSDLAKQKDFDNLIVYKSEQMQAVIETIEQLKDIPSPCLILGETGVGKSLIGKYINAKSQKYNKTFVNLNCAAIHKDLIETELFGYAQGAFTGSKKEGKKGLLELADDGVLLLDEISELPFNLQAKLLQFIQDKEFYPVGAEKPVKVDVKIIAATNRNIKKMVEMSNFREDLYYRLNVFEIEIPPLRERKEDILAVTYFFLNKYNSAYQREHKLSDEVIDIFLNYSWKGNIRELSNVIERLVVTVPDFMIMPWHLPKHLYEFDKPAPSTDRDSTLAEAISALEKEMITKAYQELKSSRKVAKKLGISQSTASRFIRKYITQAGDEDDKDLKDNEVL